MPFIPAANDILLNTSRGWLHFAHPLAVLQVREISDVRPALKEIERQVVGHQRFAAGFLSYEAAPAFDSAHVVHADPVLDFPLLWFGIYPAPELLPGTVFQPAALATLPVHDWKPDLLPTGEGEQGDDPQPTAPSPYRKAIEAIKGYIAAGDTYQVNYTYRLQAAWREPLYPTFAALAAAHNPPYAGYLETEDWAIGSLSPELFFTLDGERLTGRPMKGTAQRGQLLEDDLAWAKWLHQSEKNRAENVMIVDMVRNDMGRIARIGSVRVPELFKIEKYPTVWQMTSTVQAETAAGLDEILSALFPCASITGAPKIRTMQIIAELECSPRRIYTGAIGFYAPGRQVQFNVAIRHLRVDRRHGRAEYGVGGGIVWDSQVEEEWEETISKQRVLVELPKPFELLETMRWSMDGGWYLLEHHMQRLERSAAYFDFPFDRALLMNELDQLVAGFGDTQAQRVRLTLSRSGEIHVQHQSLTGAPLGITDPGSSFLETGVVAGNGDPGSSLAETSSLGYRIALAKTPLRSTDRFLYHKTTRREIYQSRLAEVPGVEDVLLFNERSEATESTIANLVYEMSGVLFTPPVECGLLPGTQRAELLKQGLVQERALKLVELGSCSRLWLINSVRGMWEIELMRPNAATDVVTT